MSFLTFKWQFVLFLFENVSYLVYLYLTKAVLILIEKLNIEVQWYCYIQWQPYKLWHQTGWHKKITMLLLTLIILKFNMLEKILTHNLSCLTPKSSIRPWFHHTMSTNFHTRLHEIIIGKTTYPRLSNFSFAIELTDGCISCNKNTNNYNKVRDLKENIKILQVAISCIKGEN